MRRPNGCTASSLSHPREACRTSLWPVRSASWRRDMFRESPRMFPVALPDYVRFGPVNGLRLFHELTRYPSLERLLHTPVPTLAVLGVP